MEELIINTCMYYLKLSGVIQLTFAVGVKLINIMISAFSGKEKII